MSKNDDTSELELKSNNIGGSAQRVIYFDDGEDNTFYSLLKYTPNFDFGAHAFDFSKEDIDDIIDIMNQLKEINENDIPVYEVSEEEHKHFNEPPSFLKKLKDIKVNVTVAPLNWKINLGGPLHYTLADRGFSLGPLRMAISGIKGLFKN